MSNTNYKLDIKAAARFYSKIGCPTDPDACQVWLAGKQRGGYGGFTLKGRQISAHRVAYVQDYGEFDEKLHVLHSCDNPPCTNTRHLYLGTHQDNMDDKVAKGRTLGQPGNKHAQGGTWKQGEKHHMAKLTDAQALEIRALYKAGGITQAELGRQYGVQHQCISKVITRKRFKHLVEVSDGMV